MTTVKYASKIGGGNCVTTIGWIDFSGIESVTNIPTLITNTIPGGYTITFNLSTKNQGEIMDPGQVSLSSEAAFGNTGYVGFEEDSKEGLLSQGGNVTLKINDIRIVNSTDEVINNYTIIAANAENTNLTEEWGAVTDW